MKNILLFEDFLKGGKGDNSTLESIAKAYVKKHGGNYNKVLSIVKKNYEMGLKVEMEHTDKKEVAEEISRDPFLYLETFNRCEDSTQF
jgi:hypothetical protein